MGHPALEAARRVLAVAVTGLEAGDRPVPERQLVVVGALSAWDSEQLTVAVTRPIVPGQPGRQVVRGHQHRLPSVVELRLELVRCSPIGSDDGPPTAEDSTAAAEGLLLDADALSDALQPADLAPGRAGVPVHVDAVTITPEAGGLVAVFVMLQVPR